ncbi:MAG: DUF2058 family protein [Gammaproteobacteria bacterium]|nr:DUF2058 family protein [Gammaproteobacteria bacterium]
MAESLRDQLLKMGIANEEHVKRADAAKNKPKGNPKKNTGPKGKRQEQKTKPAAKATKPAKPAVSAEDAAALEKKREIKAQIKALIEANQIADFRGETPFYYRVGERIRQILLAENIRDGIVKGEMVITRLNRATFVIPTEIAEQVLAINTEWLIVKHTPGEEQPNPADDPYAGFEVPDDLVW